MKPSRICVAWQNRSSPWPSSGRMKPKPLWFQATQTPPCAGRLAAELAALALAAAAAGVARARAARAAGRGCERGRGRGELRSAILLCLISSRTLSSERLAAADEGRGAGLLCSHADPEAAWWL